MDISTLEPAERDPVQLRRTALILLALMLLGGIMIMWAYRLKTGEDPDRPPIVTRLKSNFAAVNQHGETVDIGQLEGGIWLATVLALSDQEVSRDSLRVMKEIEEKYSAEQVVKLVCFTVDPENDTPAKLADYAREQGLTSDRWWFLAAGEEPIRGYTKDHLLLGTVVEESKGAKSRLTFPSVLAVVDAHRHVRGRYDFRQAREVAQSAQKLLREEPERAEEFYRDFGTRPEDWVDEQEELKSKLDQTLDHLLQEDLKKNNHKKP